MTRIGIKSSAATLGIVLLILLSGCGSDETAQPIVVPTTVADEAESGPGEGDDVDAAEAVAVDDEVDPAQSQAEQLEALEELWAEQRGLIADQVVASGWGLDEDGETVRGPGGWEIDLGRCPTDWEDAVGVDDGKIQILQSLALTGELGVYGDFGTGMQVYFDHVNDSGGIDGVMIDYVQRNDEYITTKTIEVIEDALDEDETPFAVSTLGTPNSLAVYDDLNDACIPHPFVMSGHPAWGDPSNHPWTTGAQLSFSSEAILWGRWLKQNMASELPLKVAGLVIDNDFGSVYEDAFSQWAEDNTDVVSEFIGVRHDPSASSIDDEIDEIAASNPDVFIAMTTGAPCRLAVEQAADSGLSAAADVRFMPSVCKDPVRYMAPAGEDANGFLVVGGGLKSTTDPQYASETFVAFINRLIAEAGYDPANGLIGTGAGFFGWNHVEALRLAAELPGGLTRSNLALATRVFDLEHPMMLSGIAFSTEGSFDSFFIEGSEFSRYDASVQSWVREGRIIDVNGVSPNCAWGRQGCG